MRLIIGDTTQTLEDWAADFGIPCALIRYRLRQGWTAERAITEPMTVRQGEKLALDATVDSEPPPHIAASWLSLTPITTSTSNPETKISCKQRAKRAPRADRRTYTHGGVSRTANEWAEFFGISRQAMHARLRTKGADAFTRPRFRF